MTLFPDHSADELPATFSPCRRYRYTLRRRWADGPVVGWIMLNPSTADEVNQDPTIRRCCNFSRDWGYGGLVVVNLFALRSTDPAALWAAHESPVGAENDAAIRLAAAGSGLVVAAWGVQQHDRFRVRSLAVEQTIREAGLPLWCLGLTQKGYPRHPLYVAGATEPVAYRVATADRTIWAADGMGRAYDGLSEEEATPGTDAATGTTEAT